MENEIIESIIIEPGDFHFLELIEDSGLDPEAVKRIEITFNLDESGNPESMNILHILKGDDK